MSEKRISLIKIFAQFLMVSALIGGAYFLVISGTDKIGLNPHRKDKIESMTAVDNDGRLTPEKAREIVERKERIDAFQLKLLMVGACLVVFTFGYSLYRKS